MPASNKEFLNVNKSEYRNQLNRNRLGLGDEVSFGIEKFVSHVSEGRKTKNKAIKYNKEMLYDELNGFFLKSYAVETKKLNDKIISVSNFDDILLDLDVINSIADDSLNDGNTTFESKEEKEYIEDLIKKFFLDNERSKINIKLNSLRWLMNSINSDLGCDHVGDFVFKKLAESDFFYLNPMANSNDTNAECGKSTMNKGTKTEEALLSGVHSKLMNIAKFLEHEDKLRKLTVTDTL